VAKHELLFSCFFIIKNKWVSDLETEQKFSLCYHFALYFEVCLAFAYLALAEKNLFSEQDRNKK
jgi:hypothetical protein